MKEKIIILIIIAAFLLSGSYYETVEKQLKDAEEGGFTDSLSEETLDNLEKIGVKGLSYEKLTSLSFQDIFMILYESFVKKINEPIKAVFSITAAAIICSLTQSFCGNFFQTEKIINAVAALSASSVFLLPMKKAISSSIAVIGECSDFMLSFIPVYSSAIIASGNVSSATGFRTLMISAVTVITRIAGEIIAPLVCIYFALCIASSLSDVNISEISKTINNFSVWLLTFSATVFSGILGLGTLVTSSGDKALSKTAKLFIGSAVPIIGGTVSDAYSALKGCLEITKNVLGTYAIVVIAAIFLPSALSLLSWKICLSVSSGISGILENKILSSLLSSASAVMGILLALVVITAIMFIFSVSIMLMTGGG